MLLTRRRLFGAGLWAFSLASAPSALAQDCAEPASSTDLTRAINDAEATIAQLDIEAFKAATDRLDALLPCLDDPVTRNVAAEVHRFLGIRAFADRRLDEAEQMFRAARALEPAYAFPDDLIPPGNPIRTAFEEVEYGEPRFETTPPPVNGGYLQLDGRTTNQRPLTWATLFQRYDGQGALQDTAYLLPADALPTYEIQVGEVPVEIPYDDPEIVTKRPVALLGATVAAGLATGVLYGIAGANKSTFANPATPYEQIDGAADRANAFTIASAVTGTATLGLGVGVALTW